MPVQRTHRPLPLLSPQLNAHVCTKHFFSLTWKHAAQHTLYHVVPQVGARSFFSSGPSAGETAFPLPCHLAISYRKVSAAAASRSHRRASPVGRTAAVRVCDRCTIYYCWAVRVDFFNHGSIFFCIDVRWSLWRDTGLVIIYGTLPSPVRCPFRAPKRKNFLMCLRALHSFPPRDSRTWQYFPKNFPYTPVHALPCFFSSFVE